jgi:hypothetical protein
LEGVDAESDSLSEREEVALTRKAAECFLKLDALTNLLKELARATGAHFRDIVLAGTAFSADGRIVDMRQSFVPKLCKQVYAPISSATDSSIFDESLDHAPVETGSPIDLTEGPVLPCVCEVSAAFASMFDRNISDVVAEGVAWRSLYLAFLDEYFVVAQPPTGDAAEPGRGITVATCLLSRLSVRMDETTPAEGTTACRLIFSYTWFSHTPPPLFLFNEAPITVKYGPFVKVEPCVSTFEVWFENQETAETAYTVLSTRIFQAKARRGARLQKYLNPEQYYS